jgi:hypothetical protein
MAVVAAARGIVSIHFGIVQLQRILARLAIRASGVNRRIKEIRAFGAATG